MQSLTRGTTRSLRHVVVSAVAARRHASPYASARVAGFGDTVWTEFTPLALKHGAVNLSQGLPSIPVEPFIREGLAKGAPEQTEPLSGMGLNMWSWYRKKVTSARSTNQRRGQAWRRHSMILSHDKRRRADLMRG